MKNHDREKDINYLANKAKREVSKLDRLENLVDSDDLDEQLVSDFLEGETDVYEIMDTIHEAITERDIMIVGLKSHIDAMNERKRRLENGVKKLKAVMCFVAIRSDKKTFVRPHYTASLKETPESLKIDDESAISSEFFKIPDPTLDKSALKKALKEGKEVKGASLTDKGVTIAIRTK